MSVEGSSVNGKMRGIVNKLFTGRDGPEVGRGGQRVSEIHEVNSGGTFANGFDNHDDNAAMSAEGEEIGELDFGAEHGAELGGGGEIKLGSFQSFHGRCETPRDPLSERERDFGDFGGSAFAGIGFGAVYPRTFILSQRLLVPE